MISRRPKGVRIEVLVSHTTLLFWVIIYRRGTTFYDKTEDMKENLLFLCLCLCSWFVSALLYLLVFLWMTISKNKTQWHELVDIELRQNLMNINFIIPLVIVPTSLFCPLFPSVLHLKCGVLVVVDFKANWFHLSPHCWELLYTEEIRPIKIWEGNRWKWNRRGFRIDL